SHAAAVSAVAGPYSPSEHYDATHYHGGYAYRGRYRSPGGYTYRGGLLIHGARATVARVRSGQMKNAWLSGLLSRRHFNVATVALANKTARVAWAVMSTEQAC